MEYQILTPDAPLYPKRIRERWDESKLPTLCYCGRLELLNRFTIAVACSDMNSGESLMAANDLGFAVREQDANLLGGWFSVVETEIFRWGLYWVHMTVSCVSFKGLAKTTPESWLRERFYPPLDDFPERERYFDEARRGRLLYLTALPPETNRKTVEQNVRQNWLACVLSDVVFLPFAEKGSRTLRLAKMVTRAGIPAFTSTCPDCQLLHNLGIPGLTRKETMQMFEQMGCPRATQPLVNLYAHPRTIEAAAH